MTLTKPANGEEEPVILGTTPGTPSMARDCSEWGSTKGAFPGRKRRLRYSLKGLLLATAFECLSNFSELLIRAILLCRVDVGDESGSHIANCKSLRELDASDTNVTDAFVQQISTLPLEKLYLNRTKVTAKSLATLAKMPKLRGVRLEQLDIRNEALDAFAAKRPDLSFDPTPALAPDTQFMCD